MKARAVARRKSRVPTHIDLRRVVAIAEGAVREALYAHKRAGNSVAVWRGGKVVMLRPEEIEA